MQKGFQRKKRKKNRTAQKKKILIEKGECFQKEKTKKSKKFDAKLNDEKCATRQEVPDTESEREGEGAQDVGLFCFQEMFWSHKIKNKKDNKSKNHERGTAKIFNETG